MKRYSIVLIVVIGISTSAAAASLEHSIFGSRETERASLDLGNACVPPVGGYARGILAGAEVPMRYSTAAEAGYSLLVPGLGQCRMGRPTRGKIYFGLEALSWFFIGASLWQGYTQDGEFKEYATYYAGVEGTGHGDDYWEAVGSYMSSGGPGGYNEAVRRDARDLYYPDIDLMNAYYEQHKITGELSWQWQSERDYRRYNDLRHGSTQAYRRALYGVAFALTLRLVSAIDAVRIAKSENAQAKENAGNISLSVEKRPGGFAVSVVRSF